MMIRGEEKGQLTDERKDERSVDQRHRQCAHQIFIQLHIISISTALTHSKFTYHLFLVDGVRKGLRNATEETNQFNSRGSIGRR
jgi:hypothetical protein